MLIRLLTSKLLLIKPASDSCEFSRQNWQSLDGNEKPFNHFYVKSKSLCFKVNITFEWQSWDSYYCQLHMCNARLESLTSVATELRGAGVKKLLVDNQSKKKTAKTVSRSRLERKFIQHQQVLSHIQCMTNHTPYAKTNILEWLLGTKPDISWVNHIDRFQMQYLQVVSDIVLPIFILFSGHCMQA